MTDYWLEERWRDGEIQPGVWRFKSSGDLDLHYVWNFAWEPKGEKSAPPQWVTKMPTTDSATGLDGTDVTIEVLTLETKRRIHRWDPDSKAEEGGLQEMNESIERMKKHVGIYPKMDL